MGYNYLYKTSSQTFNICSILTSNQPDVFCNYSRKLPGEDLQCIPLQFSQKWTSPWMFQKQPPEVICKKVFLKVSQISQENTCDTPATVFSSGICEIFKSTNYQEKSVVFPKILKNSRFLRSFSDNTNQINLLKSKWQSIFKSYLVLFCNVSVARTSI